MLTVKSTKRGRPRIHPLKEKKPLSEIFKIKKDFLTRNYPDFTQWGAGLKILSELFEIVSDVSFWKTFECKYPIFWMRKDVGKSFLLDSYAKYKKNNLQIPLTRPAEKFIISDKVGEDFQILEKPKTLKDFLYD